MLIGNMERDRVSWNVWIAGWRLHVLKIIQTSPRRLALRCRDLPAAQRRANLAAPPLMRNPRTAFTSHERNGNINDDRATNGSDLGATPGSGDRRSRGVPEEFK